MSYVVELNFVNIFQSLNTASESYKKIYWFSWKCFQVFEEKNLQKIFFDQTLRLPTQTEMVRFPASSSQQ